MFLRIKYVLNVDGVLLLLMLDCTDILHGLVISFFSNEEKSKRPNVKMELDRISNLPSDVLDKILSHLPLRDVARCCVLSSKWRYKLVMFPHLVSQRYCSSSIVDHVLSTIGPVTTFKLTCEDTSHLDRWILHLLIFNVKVFMLQVDVRGRHYKIPSCIFSCQDIIDLKLSQCLLEPPPTFKGFGSLKSLHFEYVTLAQDLLDNMLCCPLLESFTMDYCDGFSELRIDAPNLQSLDVNGSYDSSSFEDFSVVNAVNLTEVSIGVYPCSSSKFIKFFEDLPCIQRLQIMFLAAGALIEKLPKPCLHLKFLGMVICFEEREEILTALCLLRSSPVLEELEITSEFQPHDFLPVGPNSGTVNSYLDGNQSCSFPQLRHVKIVHTDDPRGEDGLEADLELIQFLLLSSPVLETLTINVVAMDLHAEESLEVTKKLLRMRRAARNVKIIYIDDDESLFTLSNPFSVICMAENTTVMTVMEVKMEKMKYKLFSNRRLRHLILIQMIHLAQLLPC